MVPNIEIHVRVTAMALQVIAICSAGLFVLMLPVGGEVTQSL